MGRKFQRIYTQKDDENESKGLKNKEKKSNEIKLPS